MELTYTELKAKAKELGLKFVGVKEKDLRVAVAEAMFTENTPTETPAETPKEKFASEQKREKVTQEDDGTYNTAVVMSGKNEVRRYTLDLHGENFKTLAKDFAGKHKYDVSMQTAKEAIICPHCGGKIYPTK